jgi:hypothetical protein
MWPNLEQFLLSPAPGTVSQICHALAEPAGHRRTRKATRAGEVEYRRTLEEPAGHGRTRDTQGLGPRVASRQRF